MPSITINADGTTSSNNSSRHASSENCQIEGVTARSGLSSRVVQDTARIHDDEVVEIDGMEIKAGMARDMGLLDAHVQRDGLKGSDAVPNRAPEDNPQPTTGHDGYDASVADIASKVEAGQIGTQEAIQYETALASVALADLTVTEVTDVIDGLADGSLDATDIDKSQLDVAKNLEATVTEAATKSALAELGQEGFDRIAQIASGDAEFGRVLRTYASMRALGKAEHTWPEFLAAAEDWTQGHR